MTMERLRSWFARAGKYKYTALILLVGVGLMLLPQEKQKQAEPETIQEMPESLEQRLEALLCQVEGAGEVEVLLTLEEGTSHTYQTDEQVSEADGGREAQRQTVLVEQSGGGEAPLTVTTRYPKYQGAVVLCRGADSPVVKLQIVSAVSDLTGLSSDKISVIKMKGH